MRYARMTPRGEREEGALPPAPRFRDRRSKDYRATQASTPPVSSSLRARSTNTSRSARQASRAQEAATDEDRRRHPVRHERPRESGHAQDGFPRSHDPDRHRRHGHGIRARTGSAPDLDKLALDDAETYRLLRAGRTVGVFQFESPLATDMLQQHARRSLRRSRRVECADATGSARRGNAQGLHAAEARRGAGLLSSFPSSKPILETPTASSPIRSR